MCVQTFRPELAVEGFDVAIISRLSGPREVERDAILIGSQSTYFNLNTDLLEF